MAKSKCRVKWKRAFPSRAVAKAELEKMRKNPRLEVGLRHLAPYQCPAGHWHLGDYTKPKPGKRRK